MKVEKSYSKCTVIVTVDGRVEDIKSVLNHASQGLDVFAKFDGFTAGATHLSSSGSRIIQYLQWESKEDHEACMKDQVWQSQESSQHFIKLMDEGAIKVDVQTYEVVNNKN